MNYLVVAHGHSGRINKIIDAETPREAVNNFRNEIYQSDFDLKYFNVFHENDSEESQALLSIE